MKKIVLAVAALLVASASSVSAQETIKIGVLEPLTGPFAASGTYVTNGAKIAADEINAKGGVLGKKIELVIEDNKSNPTEAASAAEKLMVRDKVPVIMGAWGSSSDARGHAEADGVQGADAGGDIVLGQDHDVRQSVHFPHFAALGNRGSRVCEDR